MANNLFAVALAVVLCDGQITAFGPPPPPPKASHCEIGMPQDWLQQCEAGNLLYSHTTLNTTTNGVAALYPDTGNGYLATVVKSGTIYAGGLFNGDALGTLGPTTHRARIPGYTVRWGAPTCRSDGVTASVVTEGQALDLAQAVFFERMRVPTCDDATIEDRYYAHATRPSVLVHEIVIDNIRGASPLNIVFTGALEAPSTELNLSVVSTMADGGGFELVVEGANIVPEDWNNVTGGTLTRLTMIANSPCPLTATGNSMCTVRVPPSQTKHVLLTTTIMTTRNSSNPARDARAAQTDAQVAGAVELLREHTETWALRSRRGSIAVEGDLRLAQAANASLYTIRSSIREDFPYGLSPGGLSSDGYNGHAFWDVETWMWPNLLMLDPPSARSALEYRFNRLAGASAKAKHCGEPNHVWCQPGYKAPKGGLMFPWESAVTGVEVQGGGGKLGSWGMYEQHISGDISFACRQYFYATGDLEWLKNRGYPMIRGIAEFYAARISPIDGTPGKYNYLMVMGPDEYAWPINNSGYTNTVASLAIAAAVEFAPLVGDTVPSDWRDKAAGVAAATEPVPRCGPPNASEPVCPQLHGDYHPEYTGYPKLKGPLVKQADTVMLSYPFAAEMSDTALKNDLEWYEPYTDPQGPAMTWAIFAIGWMQTGQYDRAKTRLQRSFDPNVHPPFNVWTEGLTGGCTPFLTGAGGFLQTLVFGTSGMRILSDRLTFTPAPPSATGGAVPATRISLVGFNYMGTQLTQHVTESIASYVVDSATAQAPLLFLVDADGTQHPLAVGGQPVVVLRNTSHFIKAGRKYNK